MEEPIVPSARVFRSRRVVTPEGVRPASVRVLEGVITAVEDRDAAPAGAVVHDFADAVLMPGVVDSHVHINEPGRTEWEGFETATRAAAAGGVTTVGDMPLNSVPRDDDRQRRSREKCDAATGKRRRRRRLLGRPRPRERAAIRRPRRSPTAGVPGCKCFLVPSGVDEFPHVTAADLETAMPRARVSETPYSSSTPSCPGPIEAAEAASPATPERTRPGSPRVRAPSENEAIAPHDRPRRADGLPRPHRPPLLVRRAHRRSTRRAAGASRSSVETCPHYLTFAAEEIADGRTEFKCAPPIRERENRERLWQGLARRHDRHGGLRPLAVHARR